MPSLSYHVCTLICNIHNYTGILYSYKCSTFSFFRISFDSLVCHSMSLFVTVRTMLLCMLLLLFEVQMCQGSLPGWDQWES